MAKTIIKIFIERIGNVIEVDNKAINRKPKSFSNDGAKNQMDAIPGQIEPEINIMPKRLFHLRIFF